MRSSRLSAEASGAGRRLLAQRGPVALTGVARAFGVGLAGCVVGAVAGQAVSWLVQGEGFVVNAGISLLVCAVITGVFGAIVWNVDGGDLRAALARLRARAR